MTAFLLILVFVLAIVFGIGISILKACKNIKDKKTRFILTAFVRSITFGFGIASAGHGGVPVPTILLLISGEIFHIVNLFIPTIIFTISIVYDIYKDKKEDTEQEHGE